MAVDPIGLIGSSGNVQPTPPLGPGRGAERAGGEVPGSKFSDVLMKNLEKVNQLQQDATRAIEDLQTGKRDDLETVMIATQKADTAFRMLLATRNKVLDAYEEIKQIRV